jgi:hypothetical protein
MTLCPENDWSASGPRPKKRSGPDSMSRPVRSGLDAAKYRKVVFLIWVYFWLLIFEGALRKWVFPAWSAPLLIVRDPVVILIYMVAIAEGLFPVNRFFVVIAGLAIVSFLASLVIFNNVGITLYGVRTNFLHLPLIFVMQKVMDQDDVKRLGRWVLLLAIPMTLLVTWQFASPKEAWINAAAGGELGGQMVSAGSRIRPAGLFSFVTGMVSYLSLVAAFDFGAFVDQSNMPKWLRSAGIPCLILALATSGSRSEMANVMIIVIAVLVVCVRQSSRIRTILTPAILTFAGFLALSHLPLFREGMEVNEARIRSGGGVQHGIVQRYFGDLGESIDTAASSPLFGYGLGIGTNVGSALLTGSRSFLLGEGEWSRVIAESGPILGYAYILLRLSICAHLVCGGWKALRRGQATPILLVAASLVDMVSGQFGQPSMLGFAVFTSGVALASMNRSAAPAISLESGDTKASSGAPRITPATARPARRVRGRSRIAEAIINAPGTKGESAVGSGAEDLPDTRRERK